MRARLQNILKFFEIFRTHDPGGSLGATECIMPQLGWVIRRYRVPEGTLEPGEVPWGGPGCPRSMFSGLGESGKFSACGPWPHSATCEAPRSPLGGKRAGLGLLTTLAKKNGPPGTPTELGAADEPSKTILADLRTPRNRCVLQQASRCCKTTLLC